MPSSKKYEFASPTLILLSAPTSMNLSSVLFIIVAFSHLATGTGTPCKKHNSLKQQFFIVSSVGGQLIQTEFSWTWIQLQLGFWSTFHVFHRLQIKPHNIIKLQILQHNKCQTSFPAIDVRNWCRATGFVGFSMCTPIPDQLEIQDK